ncbi:MAG: hypothetical protein D6705_18045 [Deltaproteobacteria bacterium]|nr:MAG: hypothetical protein D6705_18045 [Deltaproteobacteria bacterium]
MFRFTISRTAVADALGGLLAGGVAGGLAAAAFGVDKDAMDVLAGAWASLVPGLLAGLGIGAVYRLCRRIVADGTCPDIRRGGAVAVAAVVSGAPIVAALYVVATKLRSIHEDDLASAAGTFLTVLLVAVWVVAAWVGAGLLVRWSARWRAGQGNGWLLRAVRLAMPVGSLLVAIPVVVMEFRFGDALSSLSSPVVFVSYVSFFAVGRPLVGALSMRMGPRGHRLLVGALGGTTAAVLVSLLASGNLARRSGRAPLGSWTVAALRVATDVDRDGASPFLGDGDCAPFDADRGPSAIDVPNNGIDEDCDGQDRTVGTYAAEAKGRTSGAFPREKVAKYNVVWIIVDAVRADATTLLDPDLPTTPYLARLARESLVFTNAYSQAPATMISIPSMLTGRIPARMRWVRQGGRMSPAEEETLLAERLARIGYRTGIVVHTYFFDHFQGLFQGYEHRANLWLDGKMRPWYARSSPIAATLSIAFIEDVLRRDEATPFFLTAYFEDPHHPYHRHDEGFCVTERHTRKNAEAFGIPAMRGKVLQEKTAYLGEVAFADRYVGFLLDYLRYRKDLWDRTIVVVTADHGEEFGEHGGRKHGASCHEELVHVPLVVRIPGVEPRRVDATVALVDVVPTILEAIGQGHEVAELDGTSLLVHAFARARAESDRVVTCTAVPNNPRLRDYAFRAARTSRYLLQRDERTRAAEGFDRAADPYEQSPMDPARLPDGVGDRLLEALDRTLEGNLVADRLTR